MPLGSTTQSRWQHNGTAAGKEKRAEQIKERPGWQACGGGGGTLILRSMQRFTSNTKLKFSSQMCLRTSITCYNFKKSQPDGCLCGPVCESRDTYWSSPPAWASGLRCASLPSPSAWTSWTRLQILDLSARRAPMTFLHSLEPWPWPCPGNHTDESGTLEIPSMKANVQSENITDDHKFDWTIDSFSSYERSEIKHRS